MSRSHRAHHCTPVRCATCCLLAPFRHCPRSPLSVHSLYRAPAVRGSPRAWSQTEVRSKLPPLRGAPTATGSCVIRDTATASVSCTSRDACQAKQCFPSSRASFLPTNTFATDPTTRSATPPTDTEQSTVVSLCTSRSIDLRISPGMNSNPFTILTIPLSSISTGRTLCEGVRRNSLFF